MLQLGWLDLSLPRESGSKCSEIKMKKINEVEKLISLGSKQMEQLRKELRLHISREEFGHAWQLEALDRIFTVSQMSPTAFHRIWIQPLL